MAVKYTNNAKTTLASGLTNSATSATVTDGSAFPSLGAGEYFYITFDDGNNNEIAKVTARSGNTLTIVRAQDNTSARAFSTGDSAELRVIAAVLTEIQENIAAKSANQTVYSATAASNATDYNIGVDPGVEANASVFLDGVYQHHDTFSFSGSTLTFDAAPTNGTKIEVVVDNLINLQSSNLTVDTFTATSGQTAFTLSDAPGGESNVLAFIDGVFQNQASFTLSSNTLTFDTGVVVGRSVTVYIINPVNIGTPSDNTVTSAKLSGNITLPGSLTVGAYDVAFDSPTFVVDHTNSRVGLGTSSPSVPVDIVGEAKISSHFTFADDAELRLGNSSDVKFKHHNSGYGHLENTGILYVDSEQVIFRTDNSSIANALTLDASHNATFAGTISSGALTISQSADLHNQFISTGGDSKLSLVSADSKDAWINLSGATNEISIGYERTSSEFRVCNADTVASNVRLAINSSTGNATFAGTISSGAITSTGLTVATSSGAVINLQDTGSHNWQLTTDNQDNFFKVKDGASNTYLKVGTADSEFATNLNLASGHGYQINGTTVIDSSRNLTNIGAITSSGPITVNNVNDTYNFKAIAGDTDSWFGVYDDANNSANIIVTRSDGATSFLHLGHSGATTINGTLSSSTITVGNSNLGSNSSHLANITVNNNGYIGSANDSTALNFTTAGDIVATGKLGIGTAVNTAPADKLTVSSSNSQLRLTDSDDSKFVQFSYSGGKLITRNNSTNTTTNQFTLTEDGKFGIGDISPDATVTIGASHGYVQEWKNAKGFKQNSTGQSGANGNYNESTYINVISYRGVLVDYYESGHYFNNGAAYYFRHSKIYVIMEGSTLRVADVVLERSTGNVPSAIVNAPSISSSGTGQFTITSTISSGYTHYVSVDAVGAGFVSIGSIG